MSHVVMNFGNLKSTVDSRKHDYLKQLITFYRGFFLHDQCMCTLLPRLIYCPDLHYDFSAASYRETYRRRMAKRVLSLKIDFLSTGNTLLKKIKTFIMIACPQLLIP